MKAVTLGNGLAAANDWGNDGRLASRRLYRTGTGANLSFLAYSYDANDNIAAIRDQVDDAKSTFYGYDANDRLTLASLTVWPSADVRAQRGPPAGQPLQGLDVGFSATSDSEPNPEPRVSEKFYWTMKGSRANTSPATRGFASAARNLPGFSQWGKRPR